METSTFEVMARRAASLSRRGSLRVLGAAAFTGALAAPAAGKAGKKGQKRCQRQRGQCLAFIEEFCQPKSDPSACETLVGPCCEHFAGCHAGEGIACLFEKVFAGAG